MKILMLGWELPPYNSGGLGVACYQLCKSLSARGSDITFIVPSHARHDADFMKVISTKQNSAADAHEIYNLAYESKLYSALEQPNILQNFAKSFENNAANIAASEEFDVIHAHDWLTFRAALRAKEATGIPLIVHVHSLESDRAGGNFGNPFVHEIEQETFSIADQILVVSEHTKKQLSREYNIPLDKIAVVHNSIEPALYTKNAGDTEYAYLKVLKQHGYRIVANVGRLTIQKNLPNFLRAAQQVVFRRQKTLFLFVGSGEQEHELLELAAELGIGAHVIFAGFQRGKRWRDAFQIADLFVMPSISEPFGLTPLEAALYGTPSLISKQSGVSEVLNNCLKVDYWDTQEMANQIVGALNSDALLEQLSSNAEQEVASYNWGKSIDNLLEVYSRHAIGAAT